MHGAPYSPDVFSNELTTFVTPQSSLLFHTAASAAEAASYHGGAPEYLAYLGWPLIAALAVAAVAAWHRLAGRAATVTFIVLCVFSLGPHPLIAVREYRTVHLPWHWIQAIPILGLVLPDPLSILADGAAATLLAVGIDDIRARMAARRPSWPRLGPAAVLVVAVLCCLPLPAGWSAMFARLNLKPGSSVLVLPIPSGRVTLTMRWAAQTGEPSSMIAEYFVGPKPAHLSRLMRRTPPYLNSLWAEGVPPGSPYSTTAGTALAEWKQTAERQRVSPLSVVPAKTALAMLARWRPRAVVADTPASSPLGEYLTKLLGPPTVTVDGLIGWRITALPAPA
ncbi:MAG TPA: hypothetical protein VMA73_27145 [Streptosporangiaceae bacterium]|nr:hypothetical protein [Streptosporangiaceae bacterium]